MICSLAQIKIGGPARRGQFQLFLTAVLKTALAFYKSPVRQFLHRLADFDPSQPYWRPNGAVTGLASGDGVRPDREGDPAMSDVLLFDYWRSSASYRVRIALNLAQISYQLIY